LRGDMMDWMCSVSGVLYFKLNNVSLEEIF